ncbi:unnamed protein product [Pylaiella littoralis]
MMRSCCRSPAAWQRRAFSVGDGSSIEASAGCKKIMLAERGYVKGTQLLDDATVARLRARLPLLFRGEFDTGIYPDEMHWREGISKNDAPREIVNAWKADRTVAAVVLSERLGGLAASLAGWESARVAQDDVVWKPPGSGPVAYHQDSAYISRQFVPRENNSVTMWIALDECDREVGTIEYATMTEPLPSEQLAPESSSPSSIPSFHGANALNYRAPAVAAAASLGRKVKFEEIAVPPGGCVVHAQDCWHGSGPHLSTKRHRRALVVHFLRGDARFIDGHSLQGTGGPSYIYSRYKMLDSNALPEEAFPVTFSREGHRTSWIETFLRSH